MKKHKTFYEKETLTYRGKFRLAYGLAFLFLGIVLLIIPWFKDNFYWIYALFAIVLFWKGVHALFRTFRQIR